MTEEQAVQVVAARRDSLEIDPRMGLASAERAIVERQVKSGLASPTVEDCVAWIVTLASPSGLVEVCLDDRTGEVLRVRRSA